LRPSGRMRKKVERRQLFATGKINVKTIRSRGKEYHQRWIYIPAQLIDSGEWPFEDNEPVVFVIDEKHHRVVMQKLIPQPI
jgi:hypothetical protein